MLKMQKVNVSELNDSALDWAVAKAKDYKVVEVFGKSHHLDKGLVRVKFNPEPKSWSVTFDPHRNWEFAGPIIERERIAIARNKDQDWFAGISDAEEGINMGGDVILESCWSSGETPMIAAMRCYVASKLGNEIEIPEILCQ